MSAELPHLLTPGELGPIHLANRLVMAPMDDNMAGRDAAMTDQKISWYERRARGGVGLVMVGCTFVTPAGRSASHFQLGIDSDAAIPGLRACTERVHAAGARVGIQLCHAGRQTTSHHLPAGLAPEAPSALAEPLLGQTPTILTEARIAEIVQEFADAAARAQIAGMDAVEVHGAHGFLQHIFLSPLSNYRDDRYGGSLENRARFSIECVEAIRERVGPSMAIGFRLPCDDATEGGHTLEDALRVLEWLQDAGIDYVNVSAGRGGSYASARMILGPPGVGPGHLEVYARAVKAVARVPVMGAGRYDTPELAERVLQAGSLDFVAMGRPLIADPDIIDKLRRGAPHAIRPCVACEQGCIDRWLASLDVTCTVNPEAGRELDPRWATPSTASRPSDAPARAVLVIGGGPAGLEAARVAALDGHDVTLWEAGEQLGGQLRLAARAPFQAEWAQFVDWQVAQVTQLEVEIQLGRAATADAVLAAGADAVIVATGARPSLPRHLSGHDLPHVTTTFEVLSGRAAVGHRVVVVGGEVVGARTALMLADGGHEVTLVANGQAGLFDDGDGDLAFDMLGGVVRPMVLEWLHERVTVHTKRVLKRIDPRGVVVDAAGTFRPHLAATRVGAVDERHIAADTVVLGASRRPNDELYDALTAAGLPHMALVGDAGAPRTVTEATAEGSAAARALTPAGARTAFISPTP